MVSWASCQPRSAPAVAKGKQAYQAMTLPGGRTLGNGVRRCCWRDYDNELRDGETAAATATLAFRDCTNVRQQQQQKQNNDRRQLSPDHVSAALSPAVIVSAREHKINRERERERYREWKRREQANGRAFDNISDYKLMQLCGI